MQIPRTLSAPRSIRPWRRHIAIRAALMLLIAGLGPMPAQAQSVQDRLAQLQASMSQLQASLNSFASDITARLTVIADKLAPPSTPVPLSTGVEFRPLDHFGECRGLNVGSTAGNVRFRLMRSDGVELASTTYTLQPGHGSTLSQILGSSAALIWCRFEPQDLGVQLRAGLSISNPVTGLSVVTREAR
jgi:hypothetical protein